MEHRPLEHLAGSEAYRRRTRQAALLLLLACALLFVLAIGYELSFAGLAALVLTLVGGCWIAIRLLRHRWARSRGGVGAGDA
jgi:peptidoglycan/LPS O-acetylase OafA/YrhL